MKGALRIFIPALAAISVVAGLLVFLRLQLSESSKYFQRRAEQLGKLAANIQNIEVPGSSEAPADDEALLALRKGDLYALQGEWTKAEQEYRTSVDAGGGLIALKKLAQAQMQRRDLNGVRSTIEELKEKGARIEDLLLLDVIVFVRTGELEQAKKLLQESGDSPQKHYGLSLLAIIQGNHNLAKTELALVETGWEPVLRSYAQTLLGAYQEFSLFPESRPIHLSTLLGRALAQVQECEIALPILSQVTSEQDDYRDAWIIQGYCDLVTERIDLSLASFERAYALDPEKPEIQYFLGRTYSASGDHKNALTFLSYALKNGFKPEKEVRRILAREAELSGDLPLALEQHRLLAASPDADLAAIEAYVRFALKMGQKEDAFSAGSSATKKWPDSAAAHALLGLAADESGRAEEAKAAFEKAFSLDPSIQSVRERLEKL